MGKRIVFSLLFGLVLLIASFLLIHRSYKDLRIETACPMPGQIVPNGFVPEVIYYYGLSSNGYSTCDENVGWWSAGWPLAISPDIFGYGDPGIVAFVLAIIIDYAFWSFIAFLVLLLVWRTKKV